MGVQEYDFRDGTQELQLNLNRGEPTDVWWDTALGMTPYTTPSTNRNTPLVAGGRAETGWYLMNISDVGDTMSLDIVQEADVQGKVGVDRPALLEQPVIAGTGPATLEHEGVQPDGRAAVEREGRVLGHHGQPAGEAGRNDPGQPAGRRADGRHRELGSACRRQVQHHGQGIGRWCLGQHTGHGAGLRPPGPGPDRGRRRRLHCRRGLRRRADLAGRAVRAGREDRAAGAPAAVRAGDLVGRAGGPLSRPAQPPGDRRPQGLPERRRQALDEQPAPGQCARLRHDRRRLRCGSGHAARLLRRHLPDVEPGRRRHDHRPGPV